MFGIISAVVCTYNREQYIEGCLQSLIKQTLNKENFEIIFINNKSTDRTKEIYMNFSSNHPEFNWIYVEEEKQGLSYARNKGIEVARGDYIAFVDDDAFLEKDYLSEVFHYFEGNSNVIALGGKILTHYESIKPKWISKYIEALFGYFDLGNEKKVFKSNYPRGSNMVFRRECFEKYGVFNVELGRRGRLMYGGEEKELFMRFIKKETVVYLPSAIVYHIVPEFRTKIDFVKDQSINVGTSERLRVSGSYFNFSARVLVEFLKWVATSILFFYYFLTLNLSKGIMLIRFRYWVSKGFFS